MHDDTNLPSNPSNDDNRVRQSRSRGPGRFALSSVLGASTIFGLIALASAIFSALWPLAAFLPLAVLAIIVGMVLIGFANGSVGIACSPLVFFTAMLLWNLGDWAQEYEVRREIAALNTMVVLEPHQLHQRLAFEGSQVDGCSQDCVVYLAGGTHRSIAALIGQGKWRIWSREDPALCRSDKYVESTLEALRLGWSGVCYGSEDRTALGDAILIRSHELMRQRTRPDVAGVPTAFFGSVSEFIEVEGGRERRLGLQFSGSVRRTAPWWVQWAGGSSANGNSIREAPASFANMNVLQQAQIIAFGNIGPPPKSPIREVLASIELFLESGSHASSAGSAWTTIAGQALKVDMPDILTRVDRFLDSENPEMIRAALDLLFGVPADVKQAYRSKVLQLAFRPATYAKGCSYLAKLKAQANEAHLGVPDAIREKAKARLTSGAGLSADERWIMEILS